MFSCRVTPFSNFLHKELLFKGLLAALSRAQVWNKALILNLSFMGKHPTGAVQRGQVLLCRDLMSHHRLRDKLPHGSDVWEVLLCRDLMSHSKGSGMNSPVALMFGNFDAGVVFGKRASVERGLQQAETQLHSVLHPLFQPGSNGISPSH